MKAYVVRGGQEVEIKAREIVPGDIVRPHYFGAKDGFLTSNR